MKKSESFSDTPDNEFNEIKNRLNKLYPIEDDKPEKTKENSFLEYTEGQKDAVSRVMRHIIGN